MSPLKADNEPRALDTPPDAAFTPSIDAFDGMDDLVEQLSAIRPARQSRKARVADFLFRKTTSTLAPEAFRAANRAHTSRFFRAAVSARAGHSPHGQERKKQAMDALLAAVRPGKGQPNAVFARAKEFARPPRAGERGVHGTAKDHREDVACLLADGGDAFRQELKKAMVSSGLVGGARADKLVEVIYTALVAQFATDNESERMSHYQARIDGLQGAGLTLPMRLQALNAIDDELRADTRLSPAGKAKLQPGIDELRLLMEHGADTQHQLIAAATRGVTIQTSTAELGRRLEELAQHETSIHENKSLDGVARERLLAALGEARTLLATLRTRTQDLEGLAAQPRLQSALRQLGAQEYVQAWQGFVHVRDTVAPAWREPLLKRLDDIVTGPREAGWFTSMRAGDADIVDLVLPGEVWDEQAFALKVAGAKPRTELEHVNLQTQHEKRKVARDLDYAMQSAAFQSSVLKRVGAKGRAEAPPANAFQALKADATLIGWFMQHAPASLGQRDLAVANWIRLSLHDSATGAPDRAKCDELFGQLRARGLDTQQIELHSKQGFRSSADVLACMNQIRAFSAALQKSSAAAAVDPQVRASQIGMQLLQGLGIQATDLRDPAIDAQAERLIERALQQKSAATEVFQTLRRIAVLQVALESGDPKFTVSGRSANGGTHSSLVMSRLAAMGMNFQSRDPAMQKTTLHLLRKLPADKRTLDALCDDFDRARLTRKVGAGLRSAFVGKPAGAAASPAPLTALSPAQKRSEANEAALRGALAELEPDRSISIVFRAEGEMSVSTPVAPGLTVGAQMRAERHGGIRVSHAADGTFNVEVLAGTSTREGASVTTLMDTLDVRLGVSHARDKGHRLTFERREDCEAFLVTVARRADVASALGAARTVESAARSARSADASVTATADLTIASLSATFAAEAGESRTVHETGAIRRETFTRDVRAEAVLGAALAGDVASAEVGTGIDLGVRRTVVREHGMLVGGEPGSALAAQMPSLSMVARVTRGNLQRCLATLLPGASASQRQSIEAQLGAVEDGAELFTRFRLTETARVQANVLQGQANAALREGRPEEARLLLRRANEVTRDPANYVPEGFGWTISATSQVERSRGIYKESAQRDDERTRFVAFDAPAAGQAPVGRSLLLAALA